VIHITSCQGWRSVLAVLLAGPFSLTLTTEAVVMKILFRNLFSPTSERPALCGRIIATLVSDPLCSQLNTGTYKSSMEGL
jgi:hypothetical protein